MIANVKSLGTEHIALKCTGHEHDAVGNAESQLPPAVHECSNRQVGQREQRPALAHMAAIQVLGRYRHHCNGMLFVNFRNLTTCICCKSVSTIQQLLDIHLHNL